MTDLIPSSSQLITNIQRDSDPRGQILSIVEHPIKNVSIIESHPNTHRSNHYHYKDFHFMYVLDGEIDYFYKSLDSDDVSYLKVKEGRLFLPHRWKFIHVISLSLLSWLFQVAFRVTLILTKRIL